MHLALTTRILRIIAFAMICFGALRLADQLFAWPHWYIAQFINSSFNQLDLPPWSFSHIVGCGEVATPLFVGVFLLWLAPAIARRIQTPLHWQALGCRILVVFVGLGLLCELLGGAFATFQAIVHSSTATPKLADLGLIAVKVLLFLLPLVILWLAASRLPGSRDRDEEKPSPPPLA